MIRTLFCTFTFFTGAVIDCRGIAVYVALWTTRIALKFGTSCHFETNRKIFSVHAKVWNRLEHNWDWEGRCYEFFKRPLLFSTTMKHRQTRFLKHLIYLKWQYQYLKGPDNKRHTYVYLLRALKPSRGQRSQSITPEGLHELRFKILLRYYTHVWLTIHGKK